MKEVNDWAQTCPLCGKPNLCDMAQEQPTGECWCRDVTISAQALASIPEESVGRRCLCAACGVATGESTDEG